MNKLLKRIRIATLIIVLLEIVLGVLITLFHFFDWFDFNTWFTETGLLIFLACTIFIDAISSWICLAQIHKARHRTDEEISDVIGNEIQNAFTFGGLGILATDDNGNILWQNNLFTQRQMELLDTNIFSWHPELSELINAPTNKTLKIDEKGRNYEVKYLAEPRVFIFRDRTDYDNLHKYNEEQALCIGVVMIDNFDDIASETDELADMVADVRSLITDYFRSFGVLLRRVRNDAYFAVCNHASLSKMMKDGFSILDRTHAALRQMDHPLTLSIGFAHNFPEVGKLNEMASSAVNVALSRGGDQVVVSPYGEELIFFGGKSSAVENTSKVKVRTVSDSLMSLIRTSSEVFVMGHMDADMDALGSCLGIMAIAEHCGKKCRMVYNPKLAEKKTRIAFQDAFPKDKADQMTITPTDVLNEIRNSALLVVVDVSRPSMTMCPRLLEKASKVVVIDHHRRASEFIDHPALSYIEPSASSASELIAMMIKYGTANPKIDLNSKYATLMLSGIFLDSNSFKSKSTGMRTFEAAEILKEYGADNSLADDYLKDEFEEYSLITSIISTMKTPYYGIVYCVAPEEDVIERSTLAKVGNQLMQLKGVNACFVVGRTDEKSINISARSDGTVNVQLLCEKMGGGGHFTAAAVAFKDSEYARVLGTLELTLNEYLETARQSVKENEEK